MTPHNPKVRSWRAASVAEVCNRIGRAAMQRGAPDEQLEATTVRSVSATVTDASSALAELYMGNVTLRPHQVDAASRIRGALATYGGALLADTVGLGKTYTALAVARDYTDIQILAPAALLPMWRSAIAATRTHEVTLRSLHTLSRRNCTLDTGSSVNAKRALVIVDEAHYLRTRTTARYANVARLCTNRTVLLISATPMHNRIRELRNLLAIFLGERADATDAAVLAQCIIRRSGADVSLSIPAVREHLAPAIPDNPAVLECILTIASPLPAQDGAAASALVRLGLLRAWCSSDAALTDTIRRRQLRGEAMLQSLSQGRYPTHRELQSWVAGSDSVQLGFPELLVQSAPAECGELLKTVVRHLDSLQGLLQLHTKTSRTDPMRAAYLRQLLHEPEGTVPTRQPAGVQTLEHTARAPVIAFSQFASTVRALHRALGDIAGVASLTSGGGRIASGNIPREQLIAQFAPRANGRPPPPVRERIRLLLTTDLLAEGVNLQDADTVVHLDLPWTDALRAQRVGRLQRMGSNHAVVHVHTFAPPMGTEQALRIEATLRSKAGLHREWVGSDSAGTRESGVSEASAAEQATLLHERLRAWTNPALTSVHVTDERHDSFPVGIRNALEGGFIAAINLRGKVVLLANTSNSASQELRTVLSAVRRVDELRDADAAESNGVDQEQVATCLAQIEQWFTRQTALSLAGDSSRQLAPLQQQALHLLSAALTATPATARRRLSAALAHAERQVLSARGAGREAELGRWLADHSARSVSEWLQDVPVFVAEDGVPSARAENGPQCETVSWSVIAMVLFRPHDNADRERDLLE